MQYSLWEMKWIPGEAILDLFECVHVSEEGVYQTKARERIGKKNVVELKFGSNYSSITQSKGWVTLNLNNPQFE